MSAPTCTAHKVERGRDLRCERPRGHMGRHRWAVDDNFYPFGRLDPDDPLDQAIVRAFNRGAARRGVVSTEPPNPGSDEAREAGCICAVLDNNHGKWPGPWGWWITEGCPLHDERSEARR